MFNKKMNTEKLFDSFCLGHKISACHSHKIKMQLEGAFNVYKAELISKIKGIGATEEVDLVTVAKIINRLTLEI